MGREGAADDGEGGGARDGGLSPALVPIQSESQLLAAFLELGALFSSELDTARLVQLAGPGLFIVDQIVRAHGGTVSVRSASGVGTSFRIELPRGP